MDRRARTPQTTQENTTNICTKEYTLRNTSKGCQGTRILEPAWSVYPIGMSGLGKKIYACRTRRSTGTLIKRVFLAKRHQLVHSFLRALAHTLISTKFSSNRAADVPYYQEMKFSSIFSTAAIATLVAAADDDTTTETVFVTMTSVYGHGHSLVATTLEFTTTETFVLSLESTSAAASSESVAPTSSVAFDFSNLTAPSYNATGHNSTANATYGNGTYIFKREPAPSELAPAVTFSGFANRLGAALGVSMGAIAVVAGLLL